VKNLSVRNKLVLISVIVLLLFTLSSAVSIVLNDSALLQYRYFYDHPYQVSNLAREMQGKILFMRILIKDFILEKAVPDSEFRIDEVNRIKVELGSDIQSLRSKYLGNPGDIDAFEAGFNQWWQTASDTVATARSTNIDEAMRLSVAEATRHADRMLSSLDKIITFAYGKADAFFNNAISANGSSEITSIVALVLSVLASAILVSILTVSITRPIDAMMANIAKVEGGQPVIAIETGGRKDELGRLTEAFNRMVVYLKTQSELDKLNLTLEHQRTLEQFRVTLMSIGDAVISTDTEGKVVNLNPVAEFLTGWSLIEAKGRPIGEVFHIINARTLQNATNPITRVLKEGVVVGLANHTVLISKSGEHYQIADSAAPILDENGVLSGVVLVFRDVTEDYRKQENIINSIINSTDDFIWSVDADYNILLSNKSVEGFVKSNFGTEFKPGLHFSKVFPKDTAAAFLELFNRAKHTGALNLDLRNTMQSNRVINYSFHPIYIDSELIEITVFGRDITERINAEQEIIKMNTSLEACIAERTERLQQSIETLRNFSLTITHDLKMPLSEIEKYSVRIRDNVEPQTNASKIISMCATMNRMIAELIEYEKLSGSAIIKEKINLKEMIKSVYDEYKSENSVLDFQTGIPAVFADRKLIRHVVENLISNALKFSSHRDNPRIVVGCKRENNEYTCYIKDNGIGIDMRNAKKLFNLFECQNRGGENKDHGTGLASVKLIIEKHGGRTWIDGKVDVGTTVFFALPDGD
jgi:PAS domain S-box-containing protein